jgi:hypothetical protein
MKTDKTFDCRAMEAVLPDLLLDRAAAPASARAHLVSCAPCAAELTAMERTVQVLGDWHAPEPSPFWMSKMGARLREEQQQPSRGWARFTEGIRTRLWVSNHTLRPVGVAALGLLLAVCGGTWVNLEVQSAPAPSVQASNTVRDLQSLNQNAQVFQEMAALDGPDSNTQ